jgi:hypothetical protein
MSIGRNIIDRCGERPCIPNFYAVAKAMAEGRAPSLATRIRKTLAALTRKMTR